MADVKYWFSPKQKRMRDALNGDLTYVRVDGKLVEYTQSTSADAAVPAVWNDFTLVAAGSALECVTCPPTEVGAMAVM